MALCGNRACDLEASRSRWSHTGDQSRETWEHIPGARTNCARCGGMYPGKRPPGRAGPTRGRRRRRWRSGSQRRAGGGPRGLCLPPHAASPPPPAPSTPAIRRSDCAPLPLRSNGQQARVIFRVYRGRIGRLLKTLSEPLHLAPGPRLGFAWFRVLVTCRRSLSRVAVRAAPLRPSIWLWARLRSSARSSSSRWISAARPSNVSSSRAIVSDRTMPPCHWSTSCPRSAIHSTSIHSTSIHSASIHSTSIHSTSILLTLRAKQWFWPPSLFGRDLALYLTI